MLADLLNQLAADVRRLVRAGGSVVSGDEGLRKRADALRPLGAKVPALAVLAAAVERAAGAGHPEATPALLDLAVMVRQARTGLAAVGVEGPIEPVEAVGPWFTRMPTGEVYAVAEACTGSQPHAARHYDALESHSDADLRLVPLLLNLLEAFTPLGDVTAREVLPHFGRAVLPDLWPLLAKNGRAFVAAYRIDPDATAARTVPAFRAAGGHLKLLADVGRAGIDALFETVRRPMLGRSMHDLAGLVPEVWPKLGAEAVPALAAALRGPDVPLREIAAEALARLGRKAAAAVPELIAALQDPSNPSRYLYARPLGLIGAKEAVPVLAEVLLNDESAPVRIAAAVALGRMGKDAAAAEPALDAIARNDPEADVREQASQALQRVRPKPPPAPAKKTRRK